jgi:hypothetical protein
VIRGDKRKPWREEGAVSTRCCGDVEVKGHCVFDPELATSTGFKQVVRLASLVLL